MVKFLKDKMVQPIDSQWFQFYAPNQDKIIQPLAESNAAVSDFNFNEWYQCLMCISPVFTLYLEKFGSKWIGCFRKNGISCSGWRSLEIFERMVQGKSSTVSQWWNLIIFIINLCFDSTYLMYVSCSFFPKQTLF